MSMFELDSYLTAGSNFYKSWLKDTSKYLRTSIMPKGPDYPIIFIV